MRKQFALGMVLALGIGARAMAADGLDYNYFQAGYAVGDLGGTSIELKGLTLAGSVAIGEKFFGFASYTDASKSGIHLKPFSAGLGIHLPIGTAVDFVSGASLEHLSVTTLGGESGWGLSVGLRGVVGSVELGGGVKYVDIGDYGNDTNISFGGRYNFTEKFSAGVAATKWDDLDVTQWDFTLRYSF